MNLSFSQSGLLFVPANWQRVNVIRWLKRIHAWTGFWGAVMFFLIGLSGLLLNHRSVLKIETGEPQEVSAITVPVAAGLITDEKSLGAWAKREFKLAAEPRSPRREGGEAGPNKKSFMGVEREEAPKWAQVFNHPNGRLTVEYTPGSASVSARQDAQNFFGLIKNLHKGSGLGAGWVLFIDTIAGALLAMSLTGFLLWSGLHGSRLAAGGILLGSATLALFVSWDFLL